MCGEFTVLWGGVGARSCFVLDKGGMDWGPYPLYPTQNEILHQPTPQNCKLPTHVGIAY